MFTNQDENMNKKSLQIGNRTELQGQAFKGKFYNKQSGFQLSAESN